jgi:hypothetical protein
VLQVFENHQDLRIKWSVSTDGPSSLSAATITMTAPTSHRRVSDWKAQGGHPAAKFSGGPMFSRTGSAMPSQALTLNAVEHL